MKNKFKWAGLVAVMGFLSLASATASAAIINFGFGSVGSASNDCGSLCRSVAMSGGAIDSEGFGLWTFSSAMQLTKDNLWSSHEEVNGLSWSIGDGGLNNLYGTFSGDVYSFFGVGGGALEYLVSGGTGLFAGATGFGGSLVGFIGRKFGELGWLHVVTASSVPEPGMTALLFAGIGIMALFMIRRRREQPNR